MRKCLVAVCCNQTSIFTKTARSLVEFGWGDRVPYCREKFGFDQIAFAWFSEAPRVDMLRNRAAHQAVADGFTHLIFLDADMVWPATALHDLLAHHDRGIVAGAYFLKQPPYGPAHLKDPVEEKDGVSWYKRADEFGSELVPVSVVGMGCTIIPTQVFKDIPGNNWFHYDRDKDGWPVVSEDVPFCQDAEKAGYKIFMDPTIKCGHVGIQVIDHRYHTRYQDGVEASKEMGPMVTVGPSEDEVPA